MVILLLHTQHTALLGMYEYIKPTLCVHVSHTHVKITCPTHVTFMHVLNIMLTCYTHNYKHTFMSACSMNSCVHMRSLVHESTYTHLDYYMYKVYLC